MVKMSSSNEDIRSEDKRQGDKPKEHGTLEVGGVVHGDPQACSQLEGSSDWGGPRLLQGTMLAIQ